MRRAAVASATLAGALATLLAGCGSERESGASTPVLTEATAGGPSASEAPSQRVATVRSVPEAPETEATTIRPRRTDPPRTEPPSTKPPKTEPTTTKPPDTEPPARKRLRPAPSEAKPSKAPPPTAPPTTSTTSTTTVPPGVVAPTYEVGQQVGSIEIPAIGLSRGMFEGIELSVLDYGPGHWPDTAMPGEVGNVVVAGHRVSHNADFRDVDDLSPGDDVIFNTSTGRHVYSVVSTEIVQPDALWIVDQTDDATATLFACHPPGSVRQRIVVHLRLGA